MEKPAALVFDLGGVLVGNAMFDDLPELLGQRLRTLDVRELWLSSAAVQRFERGLIDKTAFADQLREEWGLSIGREALLERVAGWVKGFYPGAAALVDRLRTRFKIAYLSNSNALHWACLEEVLSHADVVFASHLCGLVKPDPLIFTHVADELALRPDEIVFFDDTATNVAAASRAGFRAYHTVGFAALQEAIASLGLDADVAAAPR